MTGRPSWQLLLRRPAVAVAAAALAGCGTTTSAAPAPTATAAATTAAPARCHLRDGGYPDPTCSPGAVNPRVTQANLAQTVCSTTHIGGQTWDQHERATYLPPAAAAARKRQELAAYSLGPASSYELDHLVPIGVGGDPAAVVNTWPEPWDGPHGAHAKDAVEARAHRDLCAGRITLAQVQGLFLEGQW